MHSAPSVTYPVRPSRKARLLAVCAWGAGACAVGAWCVFADGFHWQQGLGILASAAAAWGVRRAVADWTSATDIRWDGQHWSVSGPVPLQGAGIATQLDLQSALLVRVHRGRSARWLWLDQAACPERWQDLRRAVHARAPAADPVSAAPGDGRAATGSAS